MHTVQAHMYTRTGKAHIIHIQRSNQWQFSFLRSLQFHVSVFRFNVQFSFRFFTFRFYVLFNAIFAADFDHVKKPGLEFKVSSKRM